MSGYFSQTSNPEYSKFIHRSRYARWREDLGRRETWEETVDRLVSYWEEKYPDHSKVLRKEIQPAILNLEVMPSMRSLMTAGKALDRDHTAGYNCSYVAIDDVRAFDEIMYILMCGTGVGFSVERQYVVELPMVAEEMHETDTTIVVPDSKIGWASSFRELISLLYAGKIPKWDLSRLRPAGAKLKTFGGRSSGPEPLDALFRFTVALFKKAAGRRLSSLECHDLVCKTADIVVVGGVRRSALISLSNLSDDRMRSAKTGAWWEDQVQRALANNSAAYTERPEFNVFLHEWNSLYESRSGERGIFSRVASQEQAKKNGRRDHTRDFGTNPCSEIILRSKQFCNLSEVVVRPEDTPETLARKVELATILGTFQATLTDFRYLRKEWKKNTQEEALLGVSLTGIMDNELTNKVHEGLGPLLEKLRKVSVDTNKKWADKLGINQSTAITCVKPSGTVSQLVDSASGIHPRYSKYYLRTVRADIKDPLSQFMIDKGFYYEVDKTNASNLVFYFPMEAPAHAVMRDDYGALAQLELWTAYQEHWCEHKPSITVYFRDDEFLEVGNWVWKNFNKISGISFLPHTDHVYAQAPYQEITEEEYKEWLTKMPGEIDWKELEAYEMEDGTTGSQELACVAGGCEI